jgi:phage terminase small subunit
MARMTEKQKRFVEEYLIDLNATQAAIRAGYKVDNAGQTATENLTKPYIAEAIEKALAERSRRTGINQDRVIQELAKIAFVNITDVVNSDCGILPDADKADLAAIESVKVKTIQTKSGEVGIEREVKLSSKLKALEMLGKHLGMWNDKLDVNMNIPIIFEGEAGLEE